MKVVVIMPSYLGEYAGCATNRKAKFIRAVESFSAQTHQDKLLIVVSDGCNVTPRVLKQADNIHLIKLRKQIIFSGFVRMAGIEAAKKLGADIITYLDTDDKIEPNHLTNIVTAFEQNDCEWIYSNDTVGDQLRETALAWSKIGTSNISHRATVPIHWGNGYGHDWKAIEGIMNYKNVKVDFASYIVCHIPNHIDI